MHPGLIERFDRWESDSAEPAVVSVDALAAAGSNEFSDDSVKKEDDGQVTIMKEAGRAFSVTNGSAWWRPGCTSCGRSTTGRLRNLRDAVRPTSFGRHGTGAGRSTQLLISVVRVFPLGDRDEASVTVRPNTIIIGKSRYRDKAVTLQIK